MEAPIEIVNIGIWLYENGHFKDCKLFIYWILYGVFPLITVPVLALGAYIEIDFPGELKMMAGFDKDQ
jgi:hypothetical protein